MGKACEKAELTTKNYEREGNAVPHSYATTPSSSFWLDDSASEYDEDSVETSGSQEGRPSDEEGKSESGEPPAKTIEKGDAGLERVLLRG